MNTVLRTLTLATTLLGGAALAGPLTVTVYNPGEKAIFPVSSELVAGDKEAILIDAQFGVNDGKALVALLILFGALLFLVGLLVVLPAINYSIYAAYRDIYLEEQESTDAPPPVKAFGFEA